MRAHSRFTEKNDKSKRRNQGNGSPLNLLKKQFILLLSSQLGDK